MTAGRLPYRRLSALIDTVGFLGYYRRAHVPIRLS
jgi:hypothetical protein